MYTYTYKQRLLSTEASSAVQLFFFVWALLYFFYLAYKEKQTLVGENSGVGKSKHLQNSQPNPLIYPPIGKYFRFVVDKYLKICKFHLHTPSQLNHHKSTLGKRQHNCQSRDN